MSALLLELETTLRRLVRRPLTAALAVADAIALVALLVYGRQPSESLALSVAAALGAVNVLALTSGIIGDDRSTGRLALVRTHPLPPWSWVIGRWAAVTSLVTAGYLFVAAALLLASPRAASLPALGAAWTAGVLHLGALAAISVALSARSGPTVQLLIAAGVLLVGVVPPEVVASRWPAAWVIDAVRAAWTALPTPWTYARLREWALGAGQGAPLAALALAAQTAAWLALASRTLARAELGTGSD